MTTGHGWDKCVPVERRSAARLAGAPGGVGLFLIWWSLRQVRVLAVVVGGSRWWAFVEIIETKPVHSRRRSRGENPSTSLVELRRTTDEKVVGHVEMPTGWAIRVTEDGVVAVYGQPTIGARVAIGARFGVDWHAGSISQLTSLRQHEESR